MHTAITTDYLNCEVCNANVPRHDYEGHVAWCKSYQAAKPFRIAFQNMRRNIVPGLSICDVAEVVDEAARLLNEARRLMIEEGESINVTTQFDQHRWLKESADVLDKIES